MLECTFVFAGIEAAPQGGQITVGIILKVILYIKTSLLLFFYYYYNSYYY